MNAKEKAISFIHIKEDVEVKNWLKPELRGYWITDQPSFMGYYYIGWYDDMGIFRTQKLKP